jgi:RimJ/RimL family protein N-acetyltransferase
MTDLPSFSGLNVALREFKSSDSEAAFALMGDDRVTNHLSFDSRSQTEVTAMIESAIERAKIKPRVEYYLAIAHPESDLLIGFVRLALSGVQAAKLGYAIAAEYWGRGCATEAVQMFLEFGFEHLALHRVTAAIGPENAASIAVVTKIGFSHEGRLRDHVFTNGSWRDSVLYSILEQEWSRQ